MKPSPGNAWLDILNTKDMRQLIKKGPGAVIYNSSSFQKIHLLRLRFYASYQEWKNPDSLNHIQAFCLFIGHTKSGNSMLGSLIDAHPNAILSDETDALYYVQAGLRRKQLFHLLVRGSRREVTKGRITARRMEPYSWQVTGQWQGSYSTLKVIGDSTAGTSVRRLTESPDTYQRLKELMGNISVKFVHTIRNPFDPIYIMMVRGKKTFEQAFHHYELGCERLDYLYQHIGEENIFPVRYEDVISSPGAHLTSLANFLELSNEPGYIEACCRILDGSPQKIRTKFEWQPNWISQVHKMINKVHFLHGYSFDD